MEPNGDCGYELMCRWKAVHAVRSRGGGVPRQLIDEAVPADEVYAMRQAIAEEQERQTLQKCNAGLRTMIGQSMFDWWRSPLENGGRNSEVAAALKDRPAAVPEMDWLQSDQSIALHSTLVRTGGKEVFAEAAELETFSLMLGAPLAIYLPGHCELYPQSKYPKFDMEYLVGICNGNHYYLAVPKKWILEEQQQGLMTGELLLSDSKSALKMR